MSRNVSILSVMMTVMVMVTATVAFAKPNEGGNGQEKVTLCHKGHTITVGAPAVAAHERHGDTLGACAEAPPAGTTPDLTTQATASATLGDSISDQATLSGASENATGEITFKLYGPFDADSDPANDTCVDSGTGANLVTTLDPVDIGSPNSDGDFVVDSPEYTPEQSGRYQWVASYDSGDDNNGAVSGDCGDANEASVVTGPTTTSAIEQNVTVAGRDGKVAKHAKATKPTALTWGRLLKGV